MFRNLFAVVALSALAYAHIGAWHEAMWCLNGPSNDEDLNSSEVGVPLYNLSYNEFWIRGNCMNYPPPEGKFLDLPVGGKANLELSGNRAFTTLSYDGKFAGIFPSQSDHPEYDNGSWRNTCIKAPNLHTENQTRASGTALGIAYKSDIFDVKPEDVVIFSVLEHTPWHREAAYDVPKDMPECPPGGCICIWTWIANHCGTANMAMNAIRCRVTGARPDAPKLGKPVVGRWCEDDPNNCVKGPKTITIFHQQEDVNNINVDKIIQKDGLWASPGYNAKMGFYPGAQNDIFDQRAAVVPSGTDNSNSVEGRPTATPAPSSSVVDKPKPTSTGRPHHSNHSKQCKLKRAARGHRKLQSRIQRYLRP